MLRAYHYSPATRAARPCELSALPVHTKDVVEGDRFWIDLDDATTEEEEAIFIQFLAVHPLTFEDVTRMRRLPEQGAHLSKVEEFDDYLLVIVNPLPFDVSDPARRKEAAKIRRWKRPQLSALLTKRVLITHHYSPLTCIENVRKQVNARGELMHRGPDFLFHLILDEMVDEYAPVVEHFATRLDRLETTLFQRPGKEVLSHLLKLKRRVLFLRKTLILEREVLSRLVRAEFDLVTENEIHYYRNVYDHLVRYTELIEGAREMTSDLMQTQLAAVSNRLNEVMKVLTMISTVILPMTLIAGVYGMNFDHMPEIKWEYGYPMALGMMAAVAVAAFMAFRWKRWL